MAKRWTFVVLRAPKNCAGCGKPHVAVWHSLPVTAPEPKAFCAPCFEKE